MIGAVVAVMPAVAALGPDRALNKRLDATESVLRAFARTVEARDLYTIHHAERVGLYSQAFLALADAGAAERIGRLQFEQPAGPNGG